MSEVLGTQSTRLEASGSRLLKSGDGRLRVSRLPLGQGLGGLVATGFEGLRAGLRAGPKSGVGFQA